MSAATGHRDGPTSLPAGNGTRDGRADVSPPGPLPGTIQEPAVNPRVRHRRSSSELARAVRRGDRFSEALNGLSVRAANPDADDLLLAAELARMLVRRCDSRHEGWQILRDTLQAAGANVPWARAERQAYALSARRILADCATPGRTPLLRVQHAAAQERARVLAAYLDPTVTAAQLGAPDLELDRVAWPDALVAVVRARSSAGLAELLRDAVATPPAGRPAE